MRSGHTTIALWAMTLVTCAATAAPNPAATQPVAIAPTSAAIVRLEGKVDDYNRDGFFNRFNRAKASGAKVIIIDLNTYGGMVTSGLDISRFIKNQSDVRTIAYVGDKAISAGAMIAIACDEIVMAPRAQLGDCAPISVRDDGHLETLGETERAKTESPILSDFDDSARRNGYDPLLAQSMVSMKIVVRWVQAPDGNTRRFVGEGDFAKLTKEGWTEVSDADVPTPVDSASTMLTVSGKTAAKLGLARGLHGSIDSLVEARNYNVVATLVPTGGDKFIEWLNGPFVRMGLMVIFALCVYTAMHAPGHGMAEVLGVISLATLIGVPLMTGYAQWWEILVILFGIVLLALEIFVIPGFGFAGISGIVLILFGFVMTFVGKEPNGPGFLPQLEGSWVNLRNGVATVCGALFASMVVSMYLRRYLPKLPYFNRLILTTTTGNIEPTTAQLGRGGVGPDFAPIVGALGEALTELKPGGSASFYDSAIADVRVFSVISGAGYIARGAKVVVLDNRDNRILVRPEGNV